HRRVKEPPTYSASLTSGRSRRLARGRFLELNSRDNQSFLRLWTPHNYARCGARVPITPLLHAPACMASAVPDMAKLSQLTLRYDADPSPGRIETHYEDCPDRSTV